MRSSLAAFAVILALFLARPGLAQEQAGDIMNVSGPVNIARSGSVSLASAGDALLVGDVVTTGRNASAGLSFTDGSRVALGAESEFRVDAYAFEPMESRYALDVLLRRGVAVVATGKMGQLSPEAVRFSTPLAVMGIRGTKFLVKAK